VLFGTGDFRRLRDRSSRGSIVGRKCKVGSTRWC
jgi:hypothetical protein